MAKREYSVRFQCGHEGCSEAAYYTASTRKEQTELYAKYGNRKWLCVRHTNPEAVLSPSNIKTTKEYLNQESFYESRYEPEKKSLGLFWNTTDGFIFGPGFKAFSKDFPEGTKIIVTAEVILP